MQWQSFLRQAERTRRTAVEGCVPVLIEIIFRNRDRLLGDCDQDREDRGDRDRGSGTGDTNVDEDATTLSPKSTLSPASIVTLKLCKRGCQRFQILNAVLARQSGRLSELARERNAALDRSPFGGDASMVGDALPWRLPSGEFVSQSPVQHAVGDVEWQKSVVETVTINDRVDWEGTDALSAYYDFINPPSVDVSSHVSVFDADGKAVLKELLQGREARRLPDEANSSFALCGKAWIKVTYTLAFPPLERLEPTLQTWTSSSEGDSDARTSPQTTATMEGTRPTRPTPKSANVNTNSAIDSYIGKTIEEGLKDEVRRDFHATKLALSVWNRHAFLDLQKHSIGQRASHTNAFMTDVFCQHRSRRRRRPFLLSPPPCDVRETGASPTDNERMDSAMIYLDYLPPLAAATGSERSTSSSSERGTPSENQSGKGGGAADTDLSLTPPPRVPSRTSPHTTAQPSGVMSSHSLVHLSSKVKVSLSSAIARNVWTSKARNFIVNLSRSDLSQSVIVSQGQKARDGGEGGNGRDEGEARYSRARRSANRRAQAQKEGRTSGKQGGIGGRKSSRGQLLVGAHTQSAAQAPIPLAALQIAIVVFVCPNDAAEESFTLGSRAKKRAENGALDLRRYISMPLVTHSCVDPTHSSESPQITNHRNGKAAGSSRLTCISDLLHATMPADLAAWICCQLDLSAHTRQLRSEATERATLDSLQAECDQASRVSVVCDGIAAASKSPLLWWALIGAQPSGFLQFLISLPSAMI